MEIVILDLKVSPGITEISYALQDDFGTANVSQQISTESVLKFMRDEFLQEEIINCGNFIGTIPVQPNLYYLLEDNSICYLKSFLNHSLKAA